jgi:AraC-like DNA-binding protein
MFINPLYVKTLQTDSTPQLLQVQWQNTTYSCSILHAGREFYSSEDTTRQGSHAHHIYHLVLYIKGENEISYLGKIHHCRPGTLLLVSPGELHNFSPHKGGELTYVEFTFEYRNGDELLALPIHNVLTLVTGSTLSAVNYPIVLDDGICSRLTARMLALIEVLSNGLPHSLFSGHVILTDIFDILINAIYIEDKSDTKNLAARLELVRRTIESDYQRILTNDDLAALAQVSVGHFTREFKRVFGVTPGIYLQQCRTAAARNLLATTRLSCREIAARVGYADEYYFSRVFRQVTGSSPSAYRRL